MIEEALASKKQEMAVKRKDVDVLLPNDLLLPIILQLPPINELAAIRNLLVQKVSLQDTYARMSEETKELLKEQKLRLLEKHDSFKHSPTYLAHLATLNEFSGEFDNAIDCLNEAASISDEPLFHQRLGRAYLSLN